MSWELIANEGSPELRLGDERGAIRARFGTPRTFRRTPSAPETDQFVELGLLVTYDDTGVAGFIEFTAPASPTLLGVPMIGRTVHDVLHDLRNRDVFGEQDPDGATIPGWGIGLYAPSGQVEGVSVGE